MGFSHPPPHLFQAPVSHRTRTHKAATDPNSGTNPHPSRPRQNHGPATGGSAQDGQLSPVGKHPALAMPTCCGPPCPPAIGPPVAARQPSANPSRLFSLGAVAARNER